MRLLALALGALALISSGCASTPQSARAPTRATVWVAAMDADTAAVERHHEAYQRLEQGVIAALTQAGHAVSTPLETAPLRGWGNPAASTDVVALLALYANGRAHPHATTLEIEVDVQVVRTADGARLASFTVQSPGHWAVSPRCTGRCFTDALASHTHALASTVGEALAQRLVCCPGSSLNNTRVLLAPESVAPPPVGPATLVVASHPGTKSPARIFQRTSATAH